MPHIFNFCLNLKTGSLAFFSPLNSLFSAAAPFSAPSLIYPHSIPKRMLLADIFMSKKGNEAQMLRSGFRPTSSHILLSCGLYFPRDAAQARNHLWVQNLRWGWCFSWWFVQDLKELVIKNRIKPKSFKYQSRNISNRPIFSLYFIQLLLI